MENFGILIGRLGTDPQLVELGEKNAVCKFSIASDEGYGENKKVGWHQIEAWDKTAQFMKNNMKKGQKILVKVKISDGSYEKDGVKFYKTKFTAESVEPFSSKIENNSYTAEDIPFN